LLYFASSWGSIGALRGVERIGKAIRAASKDSLISAYSQKNSSGKTFGFHKTMDIAGELLGAIVVFLVFYYIGKELGVFKSIFALSLVPGVLAVITVLLFVQDAPFKEKQQATLDIKADYKLLPILLLYFGAVFFVFDSSFYIIKAKEAGYGIAYIPLLVILLNLVQTLSSYFFGVKVDKFGSKNILLLSFIFGTFSLVTLYFNWIIVSFVFLALFLVSSINSLRSYISVNAINKGTVYGVLYGGVALSTALAATVFGLVWQYIGGDAAILISISGMCILLIVGAYLIKRYPKI
jgi:MFS family permease